MIELRQALNHVLTLLKLEVDLDLWMVTRVVDNDWILLSTTHNAYGVKENDVLEWNNTVCNRMVTQQGPNIVPNIAEVEAFANAPITQQLNIQAYVGFPLKNDKGELMGTLCAIDPKQKPDEIRNQASVIESFVIIVESLLQRDQEIFQLKAKLHDYMAHERAERDLGLPNAQDFVEILKLQKERAFHSGLPISIIMIDLKRFPAEHADRDFSLQCAKDGLISLKREEDILCKLSGDTFSLLLLNADNKFLTGRVVAILKQFQRAGFKLTVGAHVCGLNESIDDAIDKAKTRTFS
uniref:sensor domain-containing diguanylate cyclase n=1 Tax=Ningiella ruwaisensis TaxID=2364274 RepID=UPI00109F1ED1|nr:GAF domain-containing protein [Ningiella ruwaisensis]